MGLHLTYRLVDDMSGNEFRKLRMSINYTQERLSKEIDVSVRGISRWEHGDITIPKIAELALRYIIAEKHQRKKGANGL
jgi:transcriptional regulator with XRE-family HTH domain